MYLGGVKVGPNRPDLAGYGLYGAGQLFGLWETRTRRPMLHSGLGGPGLYRSIASAHGVPGILPRHPVPVKIQGLSEISACDKIN